jgi:hypothetical protein
MSQVWARDRAKKRYLHAYHTVSFMHNPEALGSFARVQFTCWKRLTHEGNPQLFHVKQFPVSHAQVYHKPLHASHAVSVG